MRPQKSDLFIYPQKVIREGALPKQRIKPNMEEARSRKLEVKHKRRNMYLHSRIIVWIVSCTIAVQVYRITNLNWKSFTKHGIKNVEIKDTQLFHHSESILQFYWKVQGWVSEKNTKTKQIKKIIINFQINHNSITLIYYKLE